MNIIPAVTITNFDGSKSYDLFSLLLKERIILITGEITDETAALISSELIYLNAISPSEKITIYINSPGGSVSAGLAIYDIMKTIKSPIETIGFGLCASMGAFLLSSGMQQRLLYSLIISALHNLYVLNSSSLNV
jgi:ATP-dependent Clp protease protease subunit